jgi:competence protein ComEC
MNFDRLPMSSIPATLLALPAMPFILVVALVTGGMGLVHPALGQIAGWLTFVPLSYLLGLISFLPAPGIPGHWIGPPVGVVWYGLLAGLLFVPGRIARAQGVAGRLISAANRTFGEPGSRTSQPRWSLGFVFLALALLAVSAVLWFQVVQGVDGKLHVYFLDVGQGDSILIVTPQGKQVLVDGGPDLTSATRALAGPMSPTDRSLDMVVMTHIDSDHSRGLLEVLDRYDVATVVVGDNPMDGQSSQEWQARLEREQIDPVEVSAGQVLEVEPGVTLEVLNPAAVPFIGSGADRNNNAVVLRLVYGSMSFLLASDIEAFTEDYLVRTSPGLESIVLKAAHHGSRSSTIPAFLSQVNPAVAVISAGSGNKFGHPHPEVANRLEEALGLEAIFRTDRQGTVELVTDGVDLWVSTEKDYP